MLNVSTSINRFYRYRPEGNPSAFLFLVLLFFVFFFFFFFFFASKAVAQWSVVGHVVFCVYFTVW